MTTKVTVKAEHLGADVDYVLVEVTNGSGEPAEFVELREGKQMDRHLWQGNGLRVREILRAGSGG